MKKRANISCTDNHEKEETVKCRTEMVKRCTKMELRTHRWTQINDPARSKLVDEGKLPADFGHSCVDDNIIKIWEFHEDDSDVLLSMVNNEKWGGQLSTRAPINTKPLLMHRQDEETFKKFHFIGKS